MLALRRTGALHARDEARLAVEAEAGGSAREEACPPGEVSRGTNGGQLGRSPRSPASLPSPRLEFISLSQFKGSFEWLTQS